MKAGATRALALPYLAALGPTSLVLGPRGMLPPFHWLAQLPPTVNTCTAMASASGRPGAAVVLLRFSSSARPELVVKLGGRVEQEALGLQRFGPGARSAGARVPDAVWSGRRGDVPVLAQTVVSGETGAGRLAGRPDTAYELLERVAAWLQRWNALSAEVQQLSRAQIERLILGPATTVASALGVAGYLTQLERLCRACEGRRVPLVAAHNDLTVANLLLTESHPLGIVDWEESALGCLPLGDAYSIADAAAAVHDYRDRPAAFDACFGATGSFTALTRRLISQAGHAHGLDGELVELCLHSCWLRHAANELERSTSQDAESPFLEILRRFVTRPKPAVG
jgi:Phosphotransferase enzyme family